MNFDPQSIRFVVFDLDNTLVAPPERLLSRKLLHAISQLAAIGMPITVATGRSWPSFRPFYEQLPVNSPLILLNGASVFSPSDGVDLHHLPLMPNDAMAIYELAKDTGLHLNLYQDHDLIFEVEDEWSRYTCEKEKLAGNKVESLLPFLEAGPSKLLLVGDNQTLVQAKKRFEQANPQSGARLVFSEPDYLEVLHHSANKFTALLVLLDWMGVEAQEVLAFGDNHNDVELIAGVGMGVVVGDHCPEVATVAKTKVPGPLQEGVTNFLNETFSLTPLA